MNSYHSLSPKVSASLSPPPLSDLLLFSQTTISKMEVELDWDLHAVVRGCCFTLPKQPVDIDSKLKLTSSTPPATSAHPQPELFDLFHPFLIPPLLTPSTTSPPQLNNQLLPESSVSNSNLIQPRSTSSSSRSKRRRNQFKKVCEVPAEGLASDDTWSWRKYGQKPIKGSPYPRGYYRCSSSKGCPARKQVERSRTDPNMFIITYTAEHNHPAPTHRNSLAGIPRNQNSNKLNGSIISKPGSSVSSVPTSPSDDDDEMHQSVKAELHDYELDEFLSNELEQDEREKEVLLDDDFFDGLDDMRLPTGQQVAQI